MSISLVDLLLDAQWDPTNDVLLDRILQYVARRHLTLYPAQEEAILEILDGKNVVLNTPTGSGKSLVASALIFEALARGRRAVYTCPLKALVNEKWMALCREFGAERVGLATGDATVNRDAPVVCCTAEVLANIALRDGAEAPFDDVVMDEFHYYADRDRGVAWQVPLLTMMRARFLLMSATLGDTRVFEEALTALNGRPTVAVKAVERPVPLEFAYSEIPLAHAIEQLVAERKTPVYVVHFTQADAATSAQDFTSLKIATRDEKAEIASRIARFSFSSPYGADIRKWLRHGIGLHHAGLLPEYRLLVEQLAQAGLLKVICGTDTLGAGINVPIRTVLFTRLCKFDGQKTAILSARDFHQIAGRAGRKGFDDRGYVVIQAPEHVIENLRLSEKGQRDGRKVVKRKPPEHNFVMWDRNTFTRLIGAQPETLVSRFSVSHAMLLEVLSRPTDGCRAMQRLIRDSHETPALKRAHRRRAWQLFRSLVSRQVIEIVPRTPEGAKVRVHVDLQDDFSMDQALSLYIIETLPLLEPDSPTYALDVLTLAESVLENPELILRKQLDRLKTEAIAKMKADGLEYDERMAELEKLEYPKPLREFIYQTFNQFADRHPWVGEENIHPKSVAREMYEQFRSFAEYVLDYDLERSEGLLLRYLNSAYKVLKETVPDAAKTDEVREMELYFRALIGGVDSSLADEWERMRSGAAALSDPARGSHGEEAASARRSEAAASGPAAPPDITRDTRAFTAAVRTRVFTFLRAWGVGRHAAALESLDPVPDGASGSPLQAPGLPPAVPREAADALRADSSAPRVEPEVGRQESWTVERLRAAREAYLVEHGDLRFDPEARNLRHTHITPSAEGRTWTVEQVLVDCEGLDDWMAVLTVDLPASRAANRPVLWLSALRPIGD